MTAINAVRLIRLQEMVRNGEVVYDMVDPMPRLMILRRRYREQAWSLKDSMKPHRFLISAGPLLVVAAVHAFTIPQGRWFALGLIPATLIVLAVDWYQWVAVDLGLMRRRWSWWLGNTAEERVFDNKRNVRRAWVQSRSA